MRKIIYILLGVLLLVSATSCKDDFIEKPSVTGLNLNEVFSTAKNAEGAIAEVYGSILSSGLPALVWNPPYMPYEATEAIMGGEDVCRLNWSYMDKMCASGMIADNKNSGAGYTDDYFPNNYTYIRKAWLVYENIDKVNDMTAAQKTVVKGEMKVLVAFRYVEMLKRYGGVPIVDKTLTVVDTKGRSTVQETVDFIVGLCNDAATSLEGVKWDAEWLGRVNKGVALAVKAEALSYAARPLFNATAPYMPMGNSANNLMIWLGNQDKKRWETAITANQDVIDWGKANGFELIDTNQPLKDYGTAVGTPSNKEVLLAYKQQREKDDNGIYKNYTFIPTKTGHDLSQYRGTSFEQLAQYRKADGTDQTWTGENVWSPATEYRAKAEELEPRALASLYFYGISPKNNTGNDRFDIYKNWRLEWKWQDGCAKNCKFWYEAGSREWFEFPIYRMAEFYLNIAEAYNELGNPAQALNSLNIIRNRGGIPNETITDQGLLRKSIQREWAVEFYEENQHYPHARHWKMGASMIGGPKHKFEFSKPSNITWNPRKPEEFKDYARKSAYVANYAWNDRMSLSPFTLSEVNKGYLVQNPGY
jgi:hypothetical protein